MIAFIRGKVFAFGLDWIIIDTNNVGYRIYFNACSKVKLNQEIIIYTYQNVREDELSLYGFLTMDEETLFERLISVKGLGPKTALNIMTKASYENIINSIENKDVAFFKSMSGIGGKTASQIILDLQGKLVSSDNEEANSELKDAIEGLKSLGYKQGELNSVTKTLSKEEGLSTDEYLKKGLQILLKKKGG